MDADILLIILIGLFLAYLTGWVFQRFGLPKIFGHMLVGFVLGIPVIRNELLAGANFSLLEGLSELGLVFIMYFIGLEINIESLFSQKKDVAVISVASAIIPFVMGVVATLLFGYGLATAFVVGAIISVTSEAVCVIILKELGMLNTRIGRLIISAGIFDDIFELLILVIVGLFVNPKNSLSPAMGTVNFIFDILIFCMLVFIIRFYLMPFVIRLMGKEPSRGDLFTGSFIVVLTLAIVAGRLSIGSILGALIAGVVLKASMSYSKKIKAQENQIADYVEAFTFGFLEPLFFIWVGMNTDLSLILKLPVFCIVIILIAFVGKIIGGIAGELILGKSWKNGLIIGLGMNARGAMEIVAAEIARTNGLISQEVYTAIIAVAIVTTIISPIFFKHLAGKHREHILKDREDFTDLKI